MLNTSERDFLRLWAEGLLVSVGKLRNLIVTGFLDCLCEESPDGQYDGRFGRDGVTAHEMAMIQGALGEYESAVDRICSIWIAEMLTRAEDDRVQRAYEEYVFNTTGEIDDWWP